MSTDAIEGLPPLVLTEGGPGDALLRRLRLAPFGVRARRAALVLAAIAWIPLLVLSAIERLALGGATIPFLYDISAHMRFLVAVPVLLLAEIPIGVRLRQATAHFVAAGLVRKEDLPRFAEIISRTLHFRDSRVAELVVVAATYATTFGSLTSAIQRGSTWYTPNPATGMTAVGYWYAFVSLPIFQFLMYRWLYRMVVWARFLGEISKLDLQLSPTHPEGAGGLGFLGKACIPFGTLLFALSAVVASAVASRVLSGGARLDSFYMSYGALFVVMLAVFAGPLLVFVPTLVAVKRRGLVEYGTLASRYTQQFDRKWVKGLETTEDPLLGTADIQSLADLGNGYQLVKKMGVVPIEPRDFVAMAIPGVIPAIPLAATVMPVGEIVKDLLHLLT